MIDEIDEFSNNIQLRKPTYPTSALPGSAIKAKVMELRFARGEHIHHPDDARDADDGPGYPASEAAGAVREREIKAGRMARAGTRKLAIKNRGVITV